MKIYLCRHGETDWNKANRIQGNVNIPLNDEGIRLAQLTKDGFDKEHLHFDKVYSSTLDRAIQTATILCGHHEIIQDARISEIDFGDYEGLPVPMTPPQKEDELYNLYCCFNNPASYIPKGKGESYKQVLDRAKSFLETEIVQNNTSEECILIAAHGGIIRALLGLIEKDELHQFWSISQPNLSVNILEYKDQEIQILEIAKLYY